MNKTFFISIKMLSLFFAAGLLMACGASEDKDEMKNKTPGVEEEITARFVKEILPAATSPCFAGAYYRKVMSSTDAWLGIGGTVTLPTIEFDETRVNPKKPGQYLDNPSIYLGGRSGNQETDMGLTWEIVKEEDGSVSTIRKAFRPFLRRSEHPASGQASLYSNAPAQKEYYWYPGDVVTMSIQVAGKGKLKFIVEGEGKKYETIFDVAGYDPGVFAEYKRVNAIDQVSNEGKPVQATNTRVHGSEWSKTYLYRTLGGEVVEAAMTKDRFTDMRCPDMKHFEIASIGQSGESITIDGGRSANVQDYINEKFTYEVLPAATSPCFAGAYYRKAMSSNDVWLGIEGTVTLPTVIFDPSRVNPAKPGQYLDNPSIYLGGTSGGQETDIGLTWEVIKDENGNVSADRKAFRPFLRRSGHTASGQASLYANAPAQKEYYWYPGDVVTMSIQVAEKGKLKFVIEGEGKKYESVFDAAGYAPNTAAVYKRVNAIDQVANEGKPAQATKTRVSGAKWSSVYLLRSYMGQTVKAPMHKRRYTDMRCPAERHFVTDAIGDLGGEAINIDGAGQ